VVVGQSAKSLLSPAASTF